MEVKRWLSPFIKSPWFIAFALTVVFYMVTGYKFAWDDQHLEIPLLKHLIDPTYYQGDYYVESLAENFSSYFFPLLSKIIQVDQIPAVYFSLWLISRYFLFFWIYKLWYYLTKRYFTAICCVLVFILMARVDEFLYRTFSHQEFALGIIFAGIYYFFKGRYLLASIILGLAANFHALYSLFPMLFMLGYLLWQWKKEKISTFIKSGLVFTIGCSPFAVWVLQNRLTGASSYKPVIAEWMPLYQLACPQNFFFPLIPFKQIIGSWGAFFHFNDWYLLLIGLLILNLCFNKHFNAKAKAFAFSAVLLLIISCIWTYTFPNRFILDLNLIRNTQYLFFLLMGLTTIMAIEKVEEGNAYIGIMLGFFFTCLKFEDFTAMCAAFGLICLFTLDRLLKQKYSVKKTILVDIVVLAMLPCCYGIYYMFNQIQYKFFGRFNLLIIFILLIINFFLLLSKKLSWDRKYFLRAFVAIPICVFMFQYTYYSYERNHIENTGTGFWQLQRSWEDMQAYVKDQTPKDAMLLVPYNMEMGGFRIGSERKIVVSYRDCGIVGFDYSAAKEWRKRVKDIEAFKYNISSSPKTAMQNAVMKYGADYIVFCRYAMPKESPLMHKLYTNMDFVLFKVMK